MVGALRPARGRRGAGGRLIAERVTQDGEQGALRIEMLRPVFYRNKGAYLVGRIRQGDRVLPLVLPLLHAERGIVVDAVLLTENEASVVFGFSWSYFRVDAPRPRALVDFLSSIMPSSGWTSSTPPSATTSTARRSSTATSCATSRSRTPGSPSPRATRAW